MKIRNLPYWVDELPQNTKDRLELLLINEGIIGEELKEFFSEKTLSVFGCGGDFGSAIDCIILDEPYLYDTEEDVYYSISQIEDEYIDLAEDGNTEAENFNQYLANCLDKNGSLEWGRF